MQKQGSNRTRACPKCKGSGSISMSLVQEKTIAALGTGSTLQDVRRKLKININTATARLTRMLSAGLIQRALSGDGRTYIYAADISGRIPDAPPTPWRRRADGPLEPRR